jgi:glycogen debranching enzyme
MNESAGLRVSHLLRISCSILLLLANIPSRAQNLSPVPHFPFSQGPLKIARSVQPRFPFSVAGETGAILGEQTGRFELWCLPTKVLNNFHITADLKGYGVPIDLNQMAAEIDVQPDHTTIIYSHAAITVKQHMFTTQTTDTNGPGAIVLFEISSVLPATLTFEFEPALEQQWPAPEYERPSVSWVNFSGGGGFLLTTDSLKNFGMVAMPGTKSGILSPYQEHPQDLPLQFKLDFDPARDTHSYFPLLISLSDGKALLSDAATKALQQKIVAENNNVAASYNLTRDYYARFFDERLTTETPDPKFDQAIRWAEVAIEQTKVRHNDEVGLVAGWYPGFTTARPGFGWFFGRDTLWSLYAVNSYGNRNLSKQSLQFIARRQRADGKIMHEYAQTSELVDWPAFPYQFAAADATPLFIMAVDDYVRTTGDLDFLKSQWEAVKKAYAFARSHDSDGDGVYDNSEGSGWVESWPPKLPHQEIYLASLDLQSTQAITRLARLEGDASLAASATNQATLLSSRLKEYRTQDGMYAFSKNQDGTFDQTQTIFPSVAWWTRGSGLEDAGPMFSDWASNHFSTDWGTRSVADTAKVYDPMSYHQGTVWPLFTGWTALSEYRTGRSLSGYTHLMQNTDLTWAQDPGFVTELLSGEYFAPLGRSTAHQLWSSAMVLSPAIRGLLGIEADALHRNLHLEPHLPAAWNSALVKHVRVGEDFFDLAYERKGGQLIIDATSDHNAVLCLNAPEGKDCTQKPEIHHKLILPLPAVELGLEYTPPIPGSVTNDLKVLDEATAATNITVKLEAPSGATQRLYLRASMSKPISVDGGEQQGNYILVHFPEGTGYQTKTVTISWKNR